MKLINEQVNEAVKLKGYKIGKYIKLFNESIKSEEFKIMKKLNLENNKINHQNFKQLLNSVTNHLEVLKIGKNNLGFEGC